ncbi:BadF/BadG/BcrA/BcrD ATPase family protein [soil metagenome]
MSVYVGLDCGGSSCRILAVDDRGKLLFQGQSGAANLTSTPESRLKRNLSQASQGCPNADYVCGCFAGLIDADSKDQGLRQLRQLFPQAKLRAEPDFYAAFHAAPAETDIVVIAGTGSLVCSRDGETLRKSGGGGYILGDEGSAYQYGRDAVREYLRTPETASPALIAAIEKQFGNVSGPEIVSAVYHAPTPAGVLAKISKALASDARDGCAYALESVERNSEALARVVRGHCVANFEDRTRLVLCLAGGLWKGSALFRDAFVDALQRDKTHNFESVRPKQAPIHGAVQMAREMAHGH